ncbi:MAG: AMP-dependent synthetase, partial [SAR202 cluster bacterium]|nr:AMP-dependent synthetase [SAR202 cluster bacterium]
DGGGYLTLTGRLKELINRGGEKISPIEVEEALLKHPAVSEAVCFALPDAKYGEAVNVAVVLKGDSSEPALKSFCAGHLAAFKVPDRIFVTDNLPRTATGKVQRRHVAAKFSQ